jgi:hypothetical protein
MELSPETVKLLTEYLSQGGRKAQNELSMLVEQDPELRDALSQLWTADERMGLQKEKEAQGQKLQETPMAPGRTVRNGIFIKADPSESIRSAFHQVRGGIEEQDAQAKMADILREKGDTNQQFNRFKQDQAAKTLRNMTQDRASAEKIKGELIPGSLSGMDDGTTGAPSNKLDFAPIGYDPGPDTPARSALTDESPQRGRGYTAPSGPPNIGVAPVPKIAGPKPEWTRADMEAARTHLLATNPSAAKVLGAGTMGIGKVAGATPRPRNSYMDDVLAGLLSGGQ